MSKGRRGTGRQHKIPKAETLNTNLELDPWSWWLWPWWRT